MVVLADVAFFAVVDAGVVVAVAVLVIVGVLVVLGITDVVVAEIVVEVVVLESVVVDDFVSEVAVVFVVKVVVVVVVVVVVLVPVTDVVVVLVAVVREDVVLERVEVAVVVLVVTVSVVPVYVVVVLVGGGTERCISRSRQPAALNTFRMDGSMSHSRLDDLFSNIPTHTRIHAHPCFTLTFDAIIHSRFAFCILQCHHHAYIPCLTTYWWYHKYNCTARIMVLHCTYYGAAPHALWCCARIYFTVDIVATCRQVWHGWRRKVGVGCHGAHRHRPGSAKRRRKWCQGLSPEVCCPPPLSF